ncbi:MAG: hypothetical protein M3O91_07345 [Chloroflexota bacterium]|nr:hypothetical protein [Chloroflexota bacterium]
MGVAMQQTDREAHDRFLEQARQSLPAGTFEEAWRDGRSLAPEDARGIALGKDSEA